MILFLFTTSPELAVLAVRGGVSFIIVDWERYGKSERQAGTSFSIGRDTIEDVERLAGNSRLPVMVRINRMNPNTPREIATALSAGASGLMLPMARTRDEVSSFLKLVAGRARTLIQLETTELVTNPELIADLHWDYAHIGLNDLMLARGASSIWESVRDGTVERALNAMPERTFGFGGITVLDAGVPIPSRLNILEMARLRCGIGVLRRSFVADAVGRDIPRELSRIQELVTDAALRSPDLVAKDRTALHDAIRRSHDE